ncbi:MAG: primosomal protein N', partial [Myxococcales bacterium]|nr:primosomal protein N' [Myxococcales bacterium]
GDQQRARADIEHESGPFLLFGAPGSGKTEVYLQLIAHALAQGGGAIVLVPEIALTPQLSDRFRGRFGDTVAVLHSGLTPRQRLDAWQQIRAGQVRIVIGARSAVFAPIEDLRVIVVDEEHDASFKQEEGVRYSARDVALVRARALSAVAVLGSATPSLETFERARAGHFRWLRLTTRPTARPLPSVELVPLSVHRPDPETMLTARLLRALRDTVNAGEQAILFLNRRGFATTLVCESCGALTQCPDCSAPSMTYHLRRNRLLCHLCGHIEAPPERCKACGEGELLHGNAGTERVELAVTREVEGARVLRLDRDTSRGRGLVDTLAAFRAGEGNVLVGTQMLSKGHDFPGVTLVGILQADHGLGLPDLRAAERTFQLITQVAGRAGRGDRPGRVLMQAYAVQHPAITCARTHDFEEFATWELARRRELGNPPFGHLALVRVSGPEEEAVKRRAGALAELLRVGVAQILAQHEGEGEPVALLGPVPSPIERINKRTRWQLLLRAQARAPLRWLLRGLRPRLGADGSSATATTATVDVDPQSLL